MAQSRMLLAPLVLVFCFMSTTAVDRGNFKTCDQSGFCKRQRAMEEGKSPYVALMDTIKTTANSISLQLKNTKTNVHFNVEIGAVKSNMARLKITESEPVRPRYEPPVGDVLVKEPELDNMEVIHGLKMVSLKFGSNKAVVQESPFRIDFISDDEPVISVNARGLMKFEQYRQKDKPAEPADGENEAKEEETQEEPEEPDLFEETFKGHQDTKPHGPSSVGLDFSFPGFEYVYGIPEHADSLALRSTKSTDPYRLYNLDVFEYEVNNPMALYGSVPFMIAHNEKNTVGLFWLNAAETWVDITSNVADKNFMNKLVDFVKGGEDIPQIDTHWFSESGIIDVFFLLGPKPTDVFKQYATLTGTTSLPPLFSLAYHQSRWNYNDEQDVAGVDSGFDEYDIPMDVIWLDIEHTDGKRYFTWDQHKFPHPEEMLHNVSAKGRKIVTIVDPHIKRDDGYKIHKECRDRGLYIKNKDGNDYDGWCWPGSSGWPDFLDPAIRQYWADKFAYSEYEGSTPDLFIWNDMNEPSVFNGPEITMHKDAKHFGDWEHRDVHNIYGMYVHRATAEGLVQRSGDTERPFVLSRAFFAGTQRYGAVWTGDNTGEWAHLKMSLPMILSLNLVGITFSGADVGGFFKNPDHELLTRWYQAAAYQPFFRAHAHLDTRRREPWLLPEENKVIIREAIRIRYALLPYWYTLFYLGEKEGGPIATPLWVEFPAEKHTFALEDEHLIGGGLLVKPVTDAGATGINVYLPGKSEVWYNIYTSEKIPGGQNIYYHVSLSSIPVFQRGGYIIPRKERVRRASSLADHDPFTFTVALNNEGRAAGELYIDDYHSFQYRQGEYTHRKFVYENGQFSNRNADSAGTFETHAWLEKLVIFGLDKKPSSVQISGPNVVTEKLLFHHQGHVLTIRKPGVNIAQDWDISLQ